MKLVYSKNIINGTRTGTFLRSFGRFQPVVDCNNFKALTLIITFRIFYNNCWLLSEEIDLSMRIISNYSVFDKAPPIGYSQYPRHLTNVNTF
jgi:hypothetical protein